MSQLGKKEVNPENNIDLKKENTRREFLKKLGKYSVATSATTATLLSSNRSTASSSNALEL